ncbi:hypothetical protein SB861_25680 [Paraburkholderia sp. SIMBA_049]
MKHEGKSRMPAQRANTATRIPAKSQKTPTSNANIGTTNHGHPRQQKKTNPHTIKNRKTKTKPHREQKNPSPRSP